MCLDVETIGGAVIVPFTEAMRGPAAEDYVGESWAGWWVLHSALDAAPPPVVEVPHWQDIWNTIGGGRPWPTQRPREWHLYGSRRIAKTRESARRGAWTCAMFDPKRLARGERGVFQFYAPDRAQATIAFNYAVAFIESTPVLANLIENKTKTELQFINRTAMRVNSANFRTSRGWTAIGAHFDESAYIWDGEQSANPISELLAAVRPAMATVPTAQLSTATTPRSRTGEVWSIFDRFWMKDDPRTLVLRADHTFNPTLDPAIVAAALESDEAQARSEFFAEWRSDLENLLSRDIVSACVIPRRGNLPPQQGQDVSWFVDPAGGSGGDSFTMSGAARTSEGKVATVYVGERKPPFSPDDATAEFCAIVKQYGGTTVTGDRYGGEWPRERFRKHGIAYALSERTKTQIYQDAVPLLTAAQIELPDHQRLIGQLCSLERRVPRGGGRESIDSPPRQHDDISNAVLGAALLATIYRPAGGGEATKVSYGGPGGSRTNLCASWGPPPRTGWRQPFRIGDGPRVLPPHRRRLR